MESADGLGNLVRAVLTKAWQNRRILAVTSFGRAEGVSTINLCIARLAAAFHMKVAIVDGNFESPRLAETLGVSFDRGWIQSPAEEPLSECAVTSLADDSVLFPLRLPSPLSSVLEVDRQRVERAMSTWQTSFDLVLVDAGPIYRAAHIWFTEPVVRLVHGALVVRDARQTVNGQLDDVLQRIRGAGVTDVSVIENFQEAHLAAGNTVTCTSNSGR
jgi:Mrp family chromosome partitioning ATPase